MQLTEGLKANFKTLKLAAVNGDLALMDCYDEMTKESVGAICAVWQQGDQVEFLPLAIMPYQPLYERLRPPSQEANGEYAPLATTEQGD